MLLSIVEFNISWYFILFYSIFIKHMVFNLANIAHGIYKLMVLLKIGFSIKSWSGKNHLSSATSIWSIVLTKCTWANLFCKNKTHLCGPKGRGPACPGSPQTTQGRFRLGNRQFANVLNSSGLPGLRPLAKPISTITNAFSAPEKLTFMGRRVSIWA